ncbi:hypothetical protein OESDEN_07908 [Oesophagostomum dentatum]|uniref:Uncharacterized protein n=1 Tax=Oesophagostomum dentatum TaxID=61180 RepID=A0A0B1T8U3_OESDE|nr:hypothetical protein OESDEN_07908 [Oesophagostomum dentatum]
MPEELDSPRPSSTRKSPDLFDERSRTAENAAEEDFSWELTRLRAPTDACRPSSSKALSSKDVHSRSPSASSTQATEASVELDCVDVKEEKASGDAVCSESDGIICLDDNSRPPSSSKNQSEPHQSGDPYQDEYYNYHDPFMEAWYEPAEMSQLSMSQPVEIEENAAKRYSKSPVHEMDEGKATDGSEQSKVSFIFDSAHFCSCLAFYPFYMLLNACFAFLSSIH